jgi:O-antigen ligase
MNLPPPTPLAAGDRAARLLLGAALIGFIALDVRLGDATIERVVRLGFLGLAFLPAVYLACRHPHTLRALWRPPLVFFSVFVALLLAATPTAIAPASSLRYATGYLGVEVIVAMAAFLFTPQSVLRGLLGALAFKVIGSLPMMALASSWFLGDRFQGLAGNPNPMGAVAGLAYLLIVFGGGLEWPRTAGRLVFVGLGLASTLVLAESRSYGALTATMGALIVLAALAWLGGGRVGALRLRRSSWVIAAALLIPIAMVELGAPQRSSSATYGLNRRAELSTYWIDAISKRPWSGYGAGSTPLLAPRGAPSYRKSAHNLYLEASVYAGVPAGAAMFLFVVGTCAMALRSACRSDTPGGAGLAAVIVFYAVLSFGEPVVLNGAPSTLPPPLVVAALYSSAVGRWAQPGVRTRESGGDWPIDAKPR